MKILQAIIFLTLFYSCKNTNSTETPKNPAKEVDTLVQDEPQKRERILLYADVDKLRLRKEPGAKGDVLEQIEEGEKLLFLNEKTDYTEKIKLRAQWHEEPWLKVESEKGNTGWVFGGAVTEEPAKTDPTKTPYDDCNVEFVKARNYEAWHTCYEKVAKQQLKKDARYIKKTETGYQVTLLSGETVNLVDNDDVDAEEDFRQYAYRYYLDKMGFFVFKIQRYEGGNFILMDDKFGYATPVYGMPKMSPDLKKMVITNADVVAGFEFNGIQLFEMGDVGIETLFEEEFSDFAPHNPVWIDDKNIVFDFLSPDSAQKKTQVKAKLSEDDNGEWNLTINNPRE